MKLIAPREDGAILAQPPFAQLPTLIKSNQKLLETSKVRIAGVPLGDFRQAAREEIIASAKQYLRGRHPDITCPIPPLSPETPLLMTGHQPELFHPGVWIKNFTLYGLAQRLNGIPLHLIVDNDLMKSVVIRAPVWNDDPTHARIVSIPFDEFAGAMPYECRRILNPRVFSSLPERVKALTGNWQFQPILDDVWGIVPSAHTTIGEIFSHWRRKVEHTWHCFNLELPVSWLAETQAFRHFALDIAQASGRFRVIYNRSVQAYRKRHRLRSMNHPVPELQNDELPFWGSPLADSRRNRFPDLNSTIRPRALTLTLFARVCLGDLFIHGIGGGAYDEVTDEIIQDFYGISPPAYQVVSATLLLPLPTQLATDAQVVSSQQRLRDLYWNPQRHISDEDLSRPEVHCLWLRRQQLIASEPPLQDHMARKEWFNANREVTKALRQWVAEAIEKEQHQLEQLKRQVTANALLRRRDYAWVLHPSDQLRTLAEKGISLDEMVT